MYFSLSPSTTTRQVSTKNLPRKVPQMTSTEAGGTTSPVSGPACGSAAVMSGAPTIPAAALCSLFRCAGPVHRGALQPR